MHGLLAGNRRVSTFVPVLVSIFMLAACESEAAPTGTNSNGHEAAMNEIVTAGPLNASSTDTLVAFNLATNTVVPRSGDWDILLRRYEIRVNSAANAGTATKGVTVFAMNNNKTKTDAEVVAFTVDNTRAAFDAVRSSSIPAESSFKTDLLEENQYGYLNLGGLPTVNATNFWKVKTSTGGFAVVRATAISFSAQQALASLTLESRVQTGTTLGAVQTLTVPLTGAAVSINIATNSVVTANGCNWDLRINPTTFELTTNAACNVGTSPGGSSPTFANVTSASDAPQYSLFLAQLSGPIPNSITDAGAPFRYNLTGTNRLHPAFNTYLIKVGAKVYKLQVINYYNEAGASGWPTLRSARIQ